MALFVNKKSGIKLYVFLIVAALVPGLAAGSFIGSLYVKESVYNKTSALFFYRPASAYIEQYRFINSPDPLERLTGYYTVTPSSSEDILFLQERFENEINDVNRRAIIWILGFSEDREKAGAFLEDIYPEQNLKIKLEIKSSLRRLGLQDEDIDELNLMEE